MGKGKGRGKTGDLVRKEDGKEKKGLRGRRRSRR